MSKSIFKPSKVFQAQSLVNSFDEYKSLYEESATEPDALWEKIAKEYVTWFKPFSAVKEYNYHDAEIKFYIDGKTNVSYNCIDRHLDSRGDQTAIIWEGNEL